MSQEIANKLKQRKEKKMIVPTKEWQRWTDKEKGRERKGGKEREGKTRRTNPKGRTEKGFISRLKHQARREHPSHGCTSFQGWKTCHAASLKSTRKVKSRSMGRLEMHTEIRR